MVAGNQARAPVDGIRLLVGAPRIDVSETIPDRESRRGVLRLAFDQSLQGVEVSFDGRRVAVEILGGEPELADGEDGLCAIGSTMILAGLLTTFPQASQFNLDRQDRKDSFSVARGRDIGRRRRILILASMLSRKPKAPS